VWLALGLANLGLAFHVARYGLRGMGHADGMGEAFMGLFVACFAVPCALTALPFLRWYRRAGSLGGRAPGTASVASALLFAVLPWLAVILIWLR
jgi:hypothetical protein